MMSLESIEHLSEDSSAGIDEVTAAGRLPNTVTTDHVDEYLKIKIPPNDWRQKIQDSGCAEKDLVHKRYKQSKIQSVVYQ